MKKPAWIPTEDRKKNSNMFNFIQFLEKEKELSFREYNDLYDWSINNIEEFWESIWNYADIIHSKRYNAVLTSYKMPGAKWFTGASLNFAENLLRFNDDKIAIKSKREKYDIFSLTYNELYNLVAKCTTGLKKAGVKEGDRVAGFITNIPEAIIAMLAATSIGAVWSSCSPDFGYNGVLDRFEQIQPKILFAAEGYYYSGKYFSSLEKINTLTQKISSIKQVVVVPSFNNFKGRLHYENDPQSFHKSIKFDEFIKNDSETIEFKQLPFDHPVYIMYSSGTTGKPKCIVHGAGGTLLQHYKELVLHTDLKKNDTITYYTTCGWMMWNWLVSSLMTGVTIYLYDGSPAYPSLKILWDEIEKEKITVFGTSPKFLSTCEKAGIIPVTENKLDSLRTILSTGSPLIPENYMWVYQNIKKDLQLSSISGGTDIISCFMLGNPLLPVYEGEIQCRGLGMKVETYNEKGEIIIGEKGELVCTKPFPSMPVYFWNDNEGEKYLSAYFEDFPGVWKHGDFIKITENGGVIVYGRSDTTLNPGGVRIGTAEIYRIVESIPEVIDSLVIGQQWKNDVRVILFVQLKKDFNLDDKLISVIKNEIRIKNTPRHVPSKIIQVDDIPRTINGKKVELAVTRIINNEKIDNKEVLANPDSLKLFENIKKLMEA